MARSMVRRVARAAIATLALTVVLSQSSMLAVVAAADTGASGVAVADTVAPTTPTDFRLVSRAKSGSITLGWTASSDAVGVAGYRMYRNGAWIGTLYQAGVDRLGTVWYDKPPRKMAVTYELYAFDAAGNVSTPARLVVAP